MDAWNNFYAISKQEVADKKDELDQEEFVQLYGAIKALWDSEGKWYTPRDVCREIEKLCKEAKEDV